MVASVVRRIASGFKRFLLGQARGRVFGSVSYLVLPVTIFGPATIVAPVMILAASVLISACSPVSTVPIVERAQPPSERINQHWVASGETLYAIAWRYNMDPIDLARANNIAKPYRINAGQRLNLDLKKTRQKTAKAKSNSGPTVAARVASRNQNASSRRISQTAWQWPTQGKLKRRYTSVAHKVHNGLDIDGHRGQSIVAANTGVVVYAGEGLPAYGKLLIVKHDDVYLSAYAHNSLLIVNEGDRIKVGQKIAEMGRTGTTYEHLHFEVRKKGVPIDPLSVLPNRTL